MSDHNMEDNEIQQRLKSANRSFHARRKLLRANYDRTKQTLELMRQTLLYTVENTRVSKLKDNPDKESPTEGLGIYLTPSGYRAGSYLPFYPKLHRSLTGVNQ